MITSILSECCMTPFFGVLSLAQIITGNVEDQLDARERAEDKLRKFIAAEELEAFPAVVVDRDLLQGAKALLQCHGLGGFTPNTVLMGWSENPDAQGPYGRLLRLVKGLGRSLVIVRCHHEERLRWSAPAGTIDIWWRGGGNSSLMLLLAYLLVQNPEWRRHSIRILHPSSNASDDAMAQHPLMKMLEAARIKAMVETVPAQAGLAALHDKSRDAAVVMMGYDPPEDETEPLFPEEIVRSVNEFQNVLLVSSAGGISLSA